ncbi:cell envelope integrity protein TolA [Azohydromonas sediminis]|uniref:cell envelope integrity protein TolA n=1 Tax=Azohydromonas sediminis TaxID=2259674 RepID=UPI000E65CA73|nr:cell envelope integrity protein TolA [Azohydromonas sediminis]
MGGRSAIDPLKPPPADRLGPGAAVALGAHAALLAALALGLQWRSQSPTPVSAELWAAVPQIAAPPAPPPPPPAPPAPEPPRPAPPPAPAPEPPARREADIALERERQLREQREVEAKRQAERQRLERERVERERAERERIERERAEKARAEAEAKRQREAEQRRQAEAQRQRELAEQKRIEAQRQAQLERMLSQAQGSGSPSSSGTAARDAAPSASYAGRIVARVKPNIIFTDDVPGNPAAEVELRTLPDGTIVSRRIVKSSGVPAWDDAVLRAIDRTAVLPRDVDGRVPPSIVIVFRPRD